MILPVHFIYVGELSGKNNLDIIINKNVKNQKIYLSARVMVKNNAEISLNIENYGEGSDVRGFFVIDNHSNVNFDLSAHHLSENTGILIKTRLVAHKNSNSNLTGVAYIDKNCKNCRSDIDFSAMADKGAKIIFRPVQKISAIPESAAHSANIAHYSQPQIEYLHESGLTDIEIEHVLREAFVNNVDLFNE